MSARIVCDSVGREMVIFSVKEERIRSSFPNKNTLGAQKSHGIRFPRPGLGLSISDAGETLGSKTFAWPRGPSPMAQATSRQTPQNPRTGPLRGTGKRESGKAAPRPPGTERHPCQTCPDRTPHGPGFRAWLWEADARARPLWRRGRQRTGRLSAAFRRAGACASPSSGLRGTGDRAPLRTSRQRL